jgi:hypothetical protein
VRLLVLDGFFRFPLFCYLASFSAFVTGLDVVSGV